MPSKWHISKEGKAGNKKKDNALAMFCLLNYLVFLRPAADRSVSILWVVQRAFSHDDVVRWAILNFAYVVRWAILKFAYVVPPFQAGYALVCFSTYTRKVRCVLLP
jgi:hypothetical protein